MNGAIWLVDHIESALQELHELFYIGPKSRSDDTNTDISIQFDHEQLRISGGGKAQ